MSHLVSDAKSNNTDAEPLDGGNLTIQFVRVVRRNTVGDKNDNGINAPAALIVITEHLQSCHLETTRRVRVLAVMPVRHSVDGRHHVSLRRVVVQVEVQLGIVSYRTKSEAIS